MKTFAWGLGALASVIGILYMVGQASARLGLARLVFVGPPRPFGDLLAGILVVCWLTVALCVVWGAGNLIEGVIKDGQPKDEEP